VPLVCIPQAGFGPSRVPIRFRNHAAVSWRLNLLSTLGEAATNHDTGVDMRGADSSRLDGFSSARSAKPWDPRAQVLMNCSDRSITRYEVALITRSIRRYRFAALAFSCLLITGCATVVPTQGNERQSDLASGWRIGPVPVDSQGYGVNARVGAELTTMAVDTDRGIDTPAVVRNGNIDLERYMIAFAIEVKGIQLEAQAGAVGVSQSPNDFDSPSPLALPSESEGGYFGGLRGSVELGRLDRWRIGADLVLSANSAQIDSAVESSELYWLQADAGAAIAYCPSPEAVFALAPFVGFGVRILDGVQSTDAATLSYETEFDAEHMYGSVGAALVWRPEEQVQATAEVQALYGQVEGIAVGLSLGF
jgi:hypothetical protein